MKKEKLKRSVSTVAAAVIAAAAMSLPSAPKAPAGVSAADNVLKYEFEDGKTSGGKIHSNGVSDVKLGDFGKGLCLPRPEGYYPQR